MHATYMYNVCYQHYYCIHYIMCVWYWNGRGMGGSYHGNLLAGQSEPHRASLLCIQPNIGLILMSCILTISHIKYGGLIYSTPIHNILRACLSLRACHTSSYYEATVWGMWQLMMVAMPCVVLILCTLSLKGLPSERQMFH